MKIRVVATELLDAGVEFVSLVKNGAIRAPFKILKAEEAEMKDKREQRKRDILASRSTPRIVGSNWAQVRKSAQKAADIGMTAVMKAGIGTDEAVMDAQEGRYGADPLRADRPSERGTAENEAATLARIRDIISMLRRSGMGQTADALQAFYGLLESGTPLTKAEAEAFERTLFGVTSAFKGGSLDWLEQEGEAMRDRNRDLLSDRNLSSLDESIAGKQRDAGIKKSDAGDVLDSAFDSGLGVSGRYR